LIISRSVLVRMRNISDKFVEKIKTKSMIMCVNDIQRVKIVINDNIIEQVTDFKYLGYRISEYKMI